MSTVKSTENNLMPNLIEQRDVAQNNMLLPFHIEALPYAKPKINFDEKIDSFRSLGYNWDTNGGESISSIACDRAKKIVQQLKSKPIKVRPDAMGGIYFAFSNGDRVSIFEDYAVKSSSKNDEIIFPQNDQEIIDNIDCQY